MGKTKYDTDNTDVTGDLTKNAYYPSGSTKQDQSNPYLVNMGDNFLYDDLQQNVPLDQYRTALLNDINYYPVQTPVQIGVSTRSGDYGGSPIFSGGGVVPPFQAMQQNWALYEDEQAKKQAEDLKGLQFEYYQAKDELFNKNLPRLQHDVYQQYIDKTIYEFGGNRLRAMRYMRKDPKRTLLMAKMRNFSLFGQDVLDKINQHELESTRGREVSPGKFVRSYVPDEVKKLEQQYKAMLYSDKLSLDDMEKIDLNKLKTGLDLTDAVNDVVNDYNTRKVSRIDETARKYGTNSNEVLAIVKEGGTMSKEEMDAAVRNIQQNYSWMPESQQPKEEKIRQYIKDALVYSKEQGLDKIGYENLDVYKAKKGIDKETTKKDIQAIPVININYKDGQTQLKDYHPFGEDALKVTASELGATMYNLSQGKEVSTATNQNVLLTGVGRPTNIGKSTTGWVTTGKLITPIYYDEYGTVVKDVAQADQSKTKYVYGDDVLIDFGSVKPTIIRNFNLEKINPSGQKPAEQKNTIQPVPTTKKDPLGIL